MYVADKLREQFNPVHPGDGRDDRSPGAFTFQMLVQLLSLFGFALCLTCLYLAMRGIMRLGGMVASGGPYAIAHPAPGWAWLVPVSILTSIVFIGLNVYASHRVGGLSILPLAWPATFLSLGWNFLEFSFPTTPGHGLVWGWLVCGVVFAIMGAIPLIFIAGNAIQILRGKEKSRFFVGVSGQDRPKGLALRGRAVRVIALVVQLAAIGGGVIAADRFFHSLSTEKPKTMTERAVRPGSAVPASPPPATSQPQPLPAMLYSPRIIISFDHNTLEIVPNERRVFYHGSVYIDPKDLPLEARQVLEQTTHWLTEFLKY